MGTETSKKEREAKADQVTGFLILIVIAGFIWFSSLSSDPKPPTPWHERDNSSMAIVQVQNRVKDQLVSPSTARFSSMVANRENDNAQIYSVIGYVDSQNRLGATLRSSIFARIEQVGEGRWEIILLKIE